MKLYSEYAGASMTVRDDPDIELALTELRKEWPITIVIETGTYLGTGSTRIFAEAFSRTRVPQRFITMEGNWSYYRAAKKILKRFSFVDVKWGLSVNLQKATNFIMEDEALTDHIKYPDVFIDDVNDPKAFYLREIGTGSASASSLKQLIKKALFWQGEDLLAFYLRAYRNQRPLVILDSAGGLGQLEFTTTLCSMGEMSYAIFMDDTHHLKHFRSLEHIKRDRSFKVIRIANDQGWALAIHK